MRTIRIITISLVMLFCLPISAQKNDEKVPKVALKTNLLMDALLSPNIGFETPIAPKWTLDFTFEINAWKMSHQRRWKHWLVQPETRYWLGSPMSGHFFAITAMGGQYNFSGVGNSLKFLGTDFSLLNKYRYQGWILGAGVAYGYTWRFKPHWSLEGEIGIGYAGSHYKRFLCTGCGKLDQDHITHNYFGPTKAAVNLVYVF